MAIEINELLKHPSESGRAGHWRPARPIQYWGLYGFMLRFKDAWLIITGKAEAIYWEAWPK